MRVAMFTRERSEAARSRYGCRMGFRVESRRPNLRQYVSYLTIATVLMLSCSSQPVWTSDGTLSETSASVIYGEDDRVELYAADEVARAIGKRSVAAVISPAQLDASDLSNVRIVSNTARDALGLCADEPFADQVSAALCTSVLIDDDLVLTVGHCFLDEGDCRRNRFVFGFHLEASGLLSNITSDDVYSCRELLVRRLDPDPWNGQDYAIAKLDRPVREALAPVTIDREGSELRPGAPLFAIGFGNGVPMKLDRGLRVLEPRPNERDHFTVTADAFAGASGMPVFGSEGALLGILVRGEVDFVSNDGCYVAHRVASDCADCERDGERVGFVEHPIRELCELGWPSEALCGVASRCGDGRCAGRETPFSCAEDCEAPRCGDDFCSSNESQESCSADCSSPEQREPPKEWTCSPSSYAALDACDCGCGAPDPDCNDPFLDIRGSRAAEMCSADCRCQSPQAPSAEAPTLPEKPGLPQENHGCSVATEPGAPPLALLGWLTLVGLASARRRRTTPPQRRFGSFTRWNSITPRNHAEPTKMTDICTNVTFRVNKR